MNGGWLDYDGSNYLVPNFDQVEDCEAKNAKLSELDGMSYNCLGPYFAAVEEESPNSPYIKKVNQQFNGQGIFQDDDTGWANLGAIWESDTTWEPAGYTGANERIFKILNNQGNSTTSGIRWICKYESECKRFFKVVF